jgi:hypothetical protein
MEIVSDMDMVKDMVAEMARDKKRTPGTEFWIHLGQDTFSKNRKSDKRYW